ncbi:MAG: hypothetical protein Q8Q29_00890 [Actinomycetota bacterium]|nr:hypothetical protein [Actinomycetota bacterium]
MVTVAETAAAITKERGTLHLIFWLSVAVLVVDVGATGVVGLKQKKGWLVYGVVVCALVAWHSVAAIEIDDEVFEELLLVAALVLILTPLSVGLLVGAIRLGKPESWWLEHMSSARGKARAASRYAPPPSTTASGERPTTTSSSPVRPDEPSH